MKPVDISGFLWMPQFMLAMLKPLKEGVTVVPMVHEDADQRIEFEVRIKKLNGRPVPRNTKPIPDL